MDKFTHPMETIIENVVATEYQDIIYDNDL